ncbi:unnamed protein product [Rotaria sp. Silwood1]|nr:unnamed protein product [Rotaria sp. Silwood1]CAF3368506.1 unnamed protein product [Rotaria sp. Silwood1]CAF3378025.1 unnamed protein product [Rotaria sp. Silwood1]CAF4596089.1 unnamed protein product [Rotaria sp. Silwood1]CAF4786378.1 unnamed protein product [Rotaria sp. Silwood1]
MTSSLVKQNSNDRNTTTINTIIIIMRRHSLEHDSLGQQIKSVFTSPTRKFLNFKNNSDNSNSNIHSNRQTRRVSVPEHKYSDKLDNYTELDTIDEVSVQICI